MGKARTFSDAAREAVYQKEFDDEVYNTAAQQNSYNLGSVHFSDQSGIGNFTQAGSDQRKASLEGALFTGNIGFDLQTAVLDVGTDTINLLEDSASAALSRVSTDRIVTLSVPTTGNLVTILGAQRPGQRLTLYNTFGNTITIKNTAIATPDTIVTPGAVDFVLSGNGAVTLIFDITLAQWRIEGNLGSGGGTNLLPLDNVWTGNNSWTGQTFDVDTTTSATITSPLFIVESSLTTIGDAPTDIFNLIAHVGSSIIPTITDTFQIGSSSLEWNQIFTKEINATTETTITSPILTIESALTTFGDATTDIFNFVGRIGSSLLPTLDASFDLGSSLLEWNKLFVTEINATTQTTITSPILEITSALTTFGDATTDIFNFVGRIGSSLLPTLDLSFDLGTASLEWQNIFVGTINAFTQTTVSSPIFTINSSLITLGDAAADNINFGGQVATNIVIEEITEPGNAPTDTGRFYAKVDGGVSVPFWKDEAGTETSMIAAAGAGANTALSNLASVAINTSLLPAGDGTINLGSASFSWLDTFTERIRIETGGASTSTANQIISDAGGMIFNTPADDRYEFNISGSPNGIAIEEDRIEFLTSGRQHRIDVTGTSINILSQNITDSVEIWTGTTRTNETVDFNSETTTFLTQTDDVQAVLIQLIQNNNTPADFRTIGNIDFMAENSASSDEIYARVSASSQNTTSATEDGLLQLGVISGGTLVSGIDIEGSNSGGVNDALIGFFGETPVVQQSVASDTLANLYTALRNLGLIV